MPPLEASPTHIQPTAWSRGLRPAWQAANSTGTFGSARESFQQSGWQSGCSSAFPGVKPGCLLDVLQETPAVSRHRKNSASSV